MIPRANRLRDSREFRQISRVGKKYRSPLFVISATPASQDHDRFGFVVPKRVGNAVQRNLVKRRLRSICSELISSPVGMDLVIRAERPILSIAFDQLNTELKSGIEELRVKFK